MRKMLAEPLLQFLLLGLCLYFAIELLSPGQLSIENPRQIVVTDERLKEYLQFQRKSFEAGMADRLLDSMSAADKQTLIDNYVRDEVLFREALSLGLNENDEIIRRRLIQKMEYLAQGFYDDIAPIDEAALNIYFAENRSLYKIEAAITFTHVFVATISNGGEQGARQRAQQLLDQLNQQAVTFEQSGQYGERFLYNLNYVERTADYVASHFGEPFKQALFDLDESPQWQGPIPSEYGFHLVLIRNKAAARMPQLSEVAEIVLADAQRAQQQQLKARAVDELIGKYMVLSPTLEP